MPTKKTKKTVAKKSEKKPAKKAVKKVLRPDDSNAGCRETLLPRYL